MDGGSYGSHDQGAEGVIIARGLRAYRKLGQLDERDRLRRKPFLYVMD
jgi:hypothetical protein